MPQKLSKYQGVVVPMVSPFDQSHSIDLTGVQNLVDHLINHRAAGIFPLGTTGENASMSMRLKRSLIRATSAAVKQRAMLYVGISGTCFEESLELAEFAHQVNADAVVAHGPSYYPLSQSEQAKYFIRLADRSPLPVVLYNIPVTTHFSMSVDLVRELSSHPNIVAIKDSSGDIAFLKSLLASVGDFPVLLGSSPVFVEGLKLGGCGLVPSGAHLVDDRYARMVEAAFKGEWSIVEQMHSESNAIVAEYLTGRTLGQGLAKLKQLLSKRGLCGPTMLPPLITEPD